MYYLQRSRISEINGNYSEAKGCFDSAIAINPAHVTSLQHLVSKQNITSFFPSDSTCFRRSNCKNSFENCSNLSISVCQCCQGDIHHKLGDLIMAEKVLREAINIEPTAHVSW